MKPPQVLYECPFNLVPYTLYRAHVRLFLLLEKEFFFITHTHKVY